MESTYHRVLRLAGAVVWPRKSLQLRFVAVGVLAIVGLAATLTLGACSGESPCSGQPPEYIVKWYHRGPADIPLRCGYSSGSKGYGLVHIGADHGWSADIDAEIADTLANGEEDGKASRGWTKVYVKKYDNNNSPPPALCGCSTQPTGFRVIVGYDVFTRTDGKIRGVISGYPTT